ncbi:MAG: hypothetical protein AAGD04_05260 [Pseudomonadota bacterium]
MTKTLLLTTALFALSLSPALAGGASFASLDTDENGTISAEELAEVFGEEGASNVLERLDEDGDGTVSLDEATAAQNARGGGGDGEGRGGLSQESFDERVAALDEETLAEISDILDELEASDEDLRDAISNLSDEDREALRDALTDGDEAGERFGRRGRGFGRFNDDDADTDADTDETTETETASAESEGETTESASAEVEETAERSFGGRGQGGGFGGGGRGRGGN